MFVRVVIPPEPVVTWDEADMHLRTDGDADEQVFVEGLIAAATGWLDGPGGWLGRCLGEQTLELIDCAFGNNALPYQPVSEIVSISYRDSNGVDQEMSDTDYKLLSNGSIFADTWPQVGSGPESVRITYVAGGNVPAAIKQAILLIVGHWYANRETVNVGNIVNEMPFAASALLSTYRRWIP